MYGPDEFAVRHVGRPFRLLSGVERRLNNIFQWCKYWLFIYIYQFTNIYIIVYYDRERNRPDEFPLRHVGRPFRILPSCVLGVH